MATIYDLNGNEKGKMELPVQFSEEFRPDLIRRAVVALESHEKQVKAPKINAGARFSAYRSKRRREWKTTYGYNSSRTPGKTMQHKGTRFTLMGANVPQARGGRLVHGPTKFTIIREEINDKERRKAIRSALAATAIKSLLEKRGHIVADLKDFPIIIVNDIESLDKTKKIVQLLNSLKLTKEAERTSEYKTRAGKGKMRGRRYVTKTGPLFVVSKKCKLINAVKNVPGTDAVLAKDLNAKLLAPGTHPGRLTIWSEDAMKLLKEKKMFM